MSDAVRAFYDQLAADYHLIFADWRASVRRQGEVLARLLGPPPLTVLDCACGIGTQAIGLALQGYRVHATDLSPAAVDRARREAAGLGVVISTGVADFRSLAAQVQGSFDAVIAVDNALPHLLTDDDLLEAARSMHAKLRPGGILLASMRDYEQLAQERPQATTPHVYDSSEGRRIVFQVWDWALDGRTYQLQHFIVQEEAGGWRIRHAATPYRALLRRELTPILETAGFSRVLWHMPEETGFYQPIVTAVRP